MRKIEDSCLANSFGNFQVIILEADGFIAAVADVLKKIIGNLSAFSYTRNVLEI